MTSFSIIVPFYNTKKEYFDECISSLLNQDYKNFEIIVIDDGSNEETKKYLERYEDIDLIKIYHQHNQGLPASRRNGLKKANNDYVLFVDSDDLLALDSLSHLNQILSSNNFDVVLHDFVKYKKETTNIIDKKKWFNDGLLNKNIIIKELVQFHINSFCIKCAKREILLDSMTSLDTSIINGEDLQQSTSLIMKSQSFFYTSKDIYFYRINEEVKEYYDFRHINDINFMVPCFNLIFKERKEYSDLLCLFKLSAVKSVVDNAFLICKMPISKKEKNETLDKLNNQKAVEIIKSLDKIKISFVLQMIFNFFVYRCYFLLNILANIYYH